MVCQKIENPPIIHLQMIFHYIPYYRPYKVRPPVMYGWWVLNPSAIDISPQINPKVNQVISQLSYSSATNPMKSLIFVG